MALSDRFPAVRQASRCAIAASAFPAILLVAACSSGTSSAPASAVLTPVPPALLKTSVPATPRPRPATAAATAGAVAAEAVAAAAVVAIDNFNFTPATITIPVGSTITWTNRDDVPHTVTASDKSFSSPSIDTEAQFSQTFSAAGTFSYFCSIHPFMTAKVVVQ